MKRKETFSTIGGILAITGLISAGQALFLPDKHSRETLAISGGIQFGVGLILGLSHGPRRYSLHDGPWRIE